MANWRTDSFANVSCRLRRTGKFGFFKEIKPKKRIPVASSPHRARERYQRTADGAQEKQTPNACLESIAAHPIVKSPIVLPRLNPDRLGFDAIVQEIPPTVSAETPLMRERFELTLGDARLLFQQLT